ncbi:MAG: anti-sigma regulatory factor, partial [Clostridia bacterium]|nr:anti-sigma regulatory factor [Clostridia bacterium]
NPDDVVLISKDIGPGIPDIELAMSEGYSTASDDVRMMGFGAGMGLANMARNADKFRIESKVGEGTLIEMIFNLKQEA